MVAGIIESSFYSGVNWHILRDEIYRSLSTILLCQDILTGKATLIALNSIHLSLPVYFRILSVRDTALSLSIVATLFIRTVAGPPRCTVIKVPRSVKRTSNKTKQNKSKPDEREEEEKNLNLYSRERE